MAEFDVSKSSGETFISHGKVDEFSGDDTVTVERLDSQIAGRAGEAFEFHDKDARVAPDVHLHAVPSSKKLKKMQKQGSGDGVQDAAANLLIAKKAMKRGDVELAQKHLSAAKEAIAGSRLEQLPKGLRGLQSATTNDLVSKHSGLSGMFRFATRNPGGKARVSADKVKVTSEGGGKEESQSTARKLFRVLGAALGAVRNALPESHESAYSDSFLAGTTGTNAKISDQDDNLMDISYLDEPDDVSSTQKPQERENRSLWGSLRSVRAGVGRVGSTIRKRSMGTRPKLTGMMSGIKTLSKSRGRQLQASGKAVQVPAEDGSSVYVSTEAVMQHMLSKVATSERPEDMSGYTVFHAGGDQGKLYIRQSDFADAVVGLLGDRMPESLALHNSFNDAVVSRFFPFGGVANMDALERGVSDCCNKPGDVVADIVGSAERREIIAMATISDKATGEQALEEGTAMSLALGSGPPAYLDKSMMVKQLLAKVPGLELDSQNPIDQDAAISSLFERDAMVNRTNLLDGLESAFVDRRALGVRIKQNQEALQNIQTATVDGPSDGVLGLESPAGTVYVDASKLAGILLDKYGDGLEGPDNEAAATAMLGRIPKPITLQKVQSEIVDYMTSPEAFQRGVRSGVSASRVHELGVSQDEAGDSFVELFDEDGNSIFFDPDQLAQRLVEELAPDVRAEVTQSPHFAAAAMKLVLPKGENAGSLNALRENIAKFRADTPLLQEKLKTSFAGFEWRASPAGEAMATQVRELAPAMSVMGSAMSEAMGGAFGEGARDPTAEYEHELSGAGKGVKMIKGVEGFSGQITRDFASGIYFNDMPAAPGPNGGHDKLKAAYDELAQQCEGYTEDQVHKAVSAALCGASQTFDAMPYAQARAGALQAGGELREQGLDVMQDGSPRKINARVEEGKIHVEVTTGLLIAGGSDQMPVGTTSYTRHFTINIADSSCSELPTTFGNPIES